MKAVLFDLDGTLIDTAADFIRIIQHMCREAGRDVVEADLIRTQVSEGARAMVKLVYPELQLEDPVFLDHRQRFLDMYGADIAVDTDLFSGMYPLLEELEENDIPWGIVTNKPRWLSEAFTQSFKPDRALCRTGLSGRCDPNKPDPEPMYLAAEQLQLAAEDCIYVGDHPRDIDAGRNAKMYTILAAYGYLPLQYKDDLTAWQADYIVNTVNELHQHIQKLVLSEPSVLS